MTREELKNYRLLLKEISKVQKDIERLRQRQARLPIVKDKVQASMQDYPYTRTHIVVDARDPLANSTIEKLLTMKESLLKRLQMERLRIEEFIQNIEDSRTRQVFDMIFIRGLSQQRAAIDLEVDQATISRIIEKKLQDA